MAAHSSESLGQVTHDEVHWLYVQLWCNVLLSELPLRNSWSWHSFLKHCKCTDTNSPLYVNYAHMMTIGISHTLYIHILYGLLQLWFYQICNSLLISVDQRHAFSMAVYTHDELTSRVLSPSLPIVIMLGWGSVWTLPKLYICTYTPLPWWRAGYR